MRIGIGINIFRGAGQPPLEVLSPPVNEGLPVITGTSEAEQTLTLANAGSWAGDPTPVLTRQWLRNGATIPGATGLTFVLGSLDVGTMITCQVTATNSQGSDVAVSNAIGPIAAKPEGPTNTAPPVVSGIPEVGQILTTTNGTWTGVPAPVLTRQWRVNNADVVGQTGLTYVVQAADETFFVNCRVTATNSEDAPSELSNSLGPVTPAP